MAECAVLRIDFDRAGRARFIDDCLEMIDKTAELYARQPGLCIRDVALLTFDMSPSEKYDNFAMRIPKERDDIPPDRRENVRLLIAGVIVHERLRQAREWLGFYEGFAGAVDAENLQAFPKLNVRREVVSDIYDRMTVQSFPPHVTYALQMSDRVFMRLKAREKHLRATCGGPCVCGPAQP